MCTVVEPIAAIYVTCDTEKKSDTLKLYQAKVQKVRNVRGRCPIISVQDESLYLYLRCLYSSSMEVELT